MKNYYQEFEKRQNYIQEYFDDEKYDKEEAIYKNVYIPFIKKYLPIFIKRYFPNKVTHTNSIYNVWIGEDFYSIVDIDDELKTLEYNIENWYFLVSREDYHIFYKFVEIFEETYGLKKGRYTLKALLDAYYMELQRIENETLKEENTPNYYEVFNQERQINEDLTYTYVEELFEDEFLNKLIPRIIERLYSYIIPDSSIENVQINYETLYIASQYQPMHKYEPALIVDKKYIDYFIHLVRKFMFAYNLGNIEKQDNDTYKVKFNSLKSLVDAYYMENQRLEYIKGETLKR